MEPTAAAQTPWRPLSLLTSVAPVDYVFDTLDLHDDSEAGKERVEGWVTAFRRGFHDTRPDEDYLKHWLANARADGSVCRGAWLPDGQLGSGPIPVATYGSYDKTLNAGHTLLPLRMVTEVTVSPAHRRRGLLRRMIEDDLADAVAKDVPVAALTASEATIYGRWGFGPATFHQTVEVDTGPRFRMRSFTDEGRVEVLEPKPAWPHVRAVFDRFHRTQRGSVEWPSFYETIHSGTYDFDGGADRKLTCALHLDGTGTVDGFALYKYEGKDGDKRKLVVQEMVALTTAAGLGLWSFLGGVDLVDQVVFNLAHPDDPLPWALTDINAAKLTASEEFLWIRVLDVEPALEARPWAADDEVVLEVTDDQGHAAGCFRINSRDGHAEVRRTEDPAQVRVSAETLGSLYLGGAHVATLRRAGRVDGTDEAVARFAAMADLATEPYNITGF